MDAAETLRRARRGAGLSQRDLYGITGIAQPTIARIEAGLAMPRLDTFQRLLEACGETLISAPSAGSELDMAVLREQIQAIPQPERIALLLDEHTAVRSATTGRRSKPKAKATAKATSKATSKAKPKR